MGTEYKGRTLEKSPSAAQRAAIDHVTSSRRAMALNAVAGSGKSTLLRMLTEYTGPSTALFMFGADMKKEWCEWQSKGRIRKDVFIATGHSQGWHAVKGGSKARRCNLVERKYREPVAEIVAAAKSGTTGFFTVSEADAEIVEIALHKAVKFMRLTLASEARLMDVVDRYDIELPEEIDMDGFRTAVMELLRWGSEEAHNTGNVDYVDMLWVPVIRNYKFRQYDEVLVDESQDLSNAAIMVVTRSVSPNGRITVVGDPFQSVFGFAGASTQSYGNLINITKAAELPLDVCYRCPENHLKLVRNIVPHIKSNPDHAEGVLEATAYHKLLEKDYLPDGTIILSRFTAPLVSMCFQFIRNGITARVKGMSIGRGLAVLIRRIAKMPKFIFSEFYEFADERKVSEQQAILRRNKGDYEDPRLQIIEDRISTILTVLGSTKASSVEQLVAEVESLFSDSEDKHGIILSTVHRAKGLEAETTVILDEHKMPLHGFAGKAFHESQFQQELHVRYVALTRSKHRMIFTTTPAKDGKQPVPRIPKSY